MGSRSRLSSLALVTGLGLSLASCGGKVDSGAGTSSASLPLRLATRVVHKDARFGTPSFTWLSGATQQNLKLSANATATDVAWASVRAAQKALKLSNDAVATAQVASVHDTGRGGIITRFKQQIDGVPVFNTSMNVTMRRDHTPIAITGALAPSTKVLSQGWTTDERPPSAPASRR